jgi:signal peptidase I
MAENDGHTEEQVQLEQSSDIPPKGGARPLDYVKVIVVTVLVALVLKTFVVEAYRIPTGSMENTLLVGDFLIVNKLAYGFRTPSRVPLTNMAMPTVKIPLWGRVHRGDVVVFEYPGSIDEVRPPKAVNYVKRCIGLPGDTVRIVHGKVIVNDSTLQLPPFAKPVDASGFFIGSRSTTTFPPGTSFTQFDYGPIVVPKRGDTIDLYGGSIARWKMLIEREGHSVMVDEERNVFIDGRQTDQYVVGRNYYFMLGDNRDNSLDSRYWGYVPESNIVGEALLVYWSWNAEPSAGSAIAKSSNIRWNRIGTIIR